MEGSPETSSPLLWCYNLDVEYYPRHKNVLKPQTPPKSAGATTNIVLKNKAWVGTTGIAYGIWASTSNTIRSYDQLFRRALFLKLS